MDSHDAAASTAPSRRAEPGEQMRLAGVPRLQRRPQVSTAVQDVIKAYILDKGLRPGDPLPSETELADHLGVSRNSVREAVKALQAVGLVAARVGSGLFVGSVSIDSVIEALVFGLSGEQEIFREALDARCLIEAGMASPICEHSDPAQLRDLRRILAEWSREANAGHYTPARDGAFHLALTSRAGNHLVARFLETLWGLRGRARQRGAAPEPLDPIDNYERHRNILRALESGDPERLTKAIQAHYVAAHDDLRMPLGPTNPSPKRIREPGVRSNQRVARRKNR